MKTLNNLKLMTLSLSLAIDATACTSADVRNAASSIPRTQESQQVIVYKSNSNGFDTRSFFYIAENEVIAIDAQFTPSLARESISYLRQFTQKPITRLIITHPNPDKFNGASEFKKEGAQIIASEATARAIPGVHAYKEHFFVEVAKMFKPGEYPTPPVIDQTFSGTLHLDLNSSDFLALRELSHPGVSSTQTVVHIPAVNALFVGDLVHVQAHAWLEGGIENGNPVPHITGWIKDLNEISNRYHRNVKIYGGRGQTATLKQAIPEQKSYLKLALKLAKVVVEKNPSADLTTLSQEFTQVMTKEFPNYELPYMITYGSYGLLQQIQK